MKILHSSQSKNFFLLEMDETKGYFKKLVYLIFEKQGLIHKRK